MWELVYGPLMFGLGCICGFYYSRYVAYGPILKCWKEIAKEYEELRGIEEKKILERKKTKGITLGT